MAASNATGTIGRVSKRIGRYVNHDDVLVRFVSLWVVVASVFTAAWILSYLLLPHGLLRNYKENAPPFRVGRMSKVRQSLHTHSVPETEGGGQD